MKLVNSISRNSMRLFTWQKFVVSDLMCCRHDFFTAGLPEMVFSRKKNKHTVTKRSANKRYVISKPLIHVNNNIAEMVPRVGLSQ